MMKNLMRTASASISILGGILIATSLCVAQNNNAGATKPESKANNHIKEKYNKSKNETTVILKTMALSNSMNKEFTRESEYTNLDLDVSFTYPGQQISKPAEAAFFKFKSTAKEMHWQHGQNLVAVIDDESGVILGPTNYSSSSQTYYFEEDLSISIPYEAMKRFASAKKLAFQLGTRSIPITNDQLNDLRAITALMAP
jgi:hypothetical protein